MGIQIFSKIGDEAARVVTVKRLKALPEVGERIEIRARGEFRFYPVRVVEVVVPEPGTDLPLFTLERL